MTKKELQKILIERNVPINIYCLDGKLYPDKFELCYKNDKWMVYYCDERGVKHDLTTFENEEDACQHFYDYISKEMFC